MIGGEGTGGGIGDGGGGAGGDGGGEGGCGGAVASSHGAAENGSVGDCDFTTEEAFDPGCEDGDASRGDTRAGLF